MGMKKILHSHPNLVIGTLAVIFIGTLATFSLWAVSDIFTEVQAGLVAPAPASQAGFDLTAASKLDLRGIVVSTSSTSTQ